MRIFIPPFILLLMLYLLFWPVPIDPQAWTPPAAPPLEGDYAVNDKLAGAERIGVGVGVGPETVSVPTPTPTPMRSAAASLSFTA